MQWPFVLGLFCLLWAAVVYLGVRAIASPRTDRASVYASASALAAALVVGVVLARSHRPAAPAGSDVISAGRSFSCARVLTAAVGVAHGSVDIVQAQPHSVTVTPESPIGRTAVLFLRGWATDADVHHALAGVCLLVDGKPLARVVVSYGSSRPDVAQVFKDAAVLGSGFEIRVPASAIAPGKHRLEVVGVDGRGRESAIAPPFALTVR